MRSEGRFRSSKGCVPSKHHFQPPEMVQTCPRQQVKFQSNLEWRGCQTDSNQLLGGGTSGKRDYGGGGGPELLNGREPASRKKMDSTWEWGKMKGVSKYYLGFHFSIFLNYFILIIVVLIYLFYYVLGKFCWNL